MTRKENENKLLVFVLQTVLMSFSIFSALNN